MNKDKIQALKDEMRKKREELNEVCREEFKKAARELFDKFPSLTSFGLKAYTIYYADGDECTFSAYTEDPDINGIDGNEVAYEDEQIANLNS